MTLYLGLDIHSKLSVYVAQDPDGKTIAQGEVATSPAGFDHLIKALQLPPATPIALESGTLAAYVTGLLQERAMAPQVINAREVRAKARNPRQKSDRRDAFELCDGLRRGLWVSIVWQPPAPIERLRAILSRRRHFVAQGVRQVNAVKFLLRRRGQGSLYRSLTTEPAWRQMLERPELADLKQHLLLHFRLWQQVQRTLGQLERELSRASKPLARELELLQSLPGVGPVVAATFLATLGDPGRFASAAHVIGYIGLAVSTYDSGESERHGRITKAGSPALRAMLCEAAHHAARATHPLHPYFARQAARKGVKSAVVAVAQRMARILWQMWRQGRAFDPGRLNVEPVHKVKSRIQHWEIRPGKATAA